MTTKNPSDFKPGEIVRHPGDGRIGITHLHDDEGCEPGICVTYYWPNEGSLWGRAYGNLADWERVGTVQPGHVQVRVDDISGYDLWDEEDLRNRVLAAGRSWHLKHKAESTPPADARPHSRACGIRRHPHGPECHTNCLTCGGKAPNDEQNATVANESPAMTGETGDEQPTTATVTLPCPDCGEIFGDGVHVLTGLGDWKFITFDAGNAPSHRCKTVQPDEPAEFGARVTVRFLNGVTRKLLRVANDGAHDGYPWMADDGRYRKWPDLVLYGTVTLGWGDDAS